MTSVLTQYTSLQRILLLAVGLWPYQQSIVTRFQITVFSVIQTSFIILQLTTFLTTECTFDLIAKVLSITLPLFICLIQYNSFWIYLNDVKYIFEQLQYICNELKDENEIAIIRKYGKNAKYQTIFILWIVVSGTFIIIFMPLGPCILNIVLQINESRPHMYVMITHFVDSERYFYFILLHTDVVICISVLTILAPTTSFMAYSKYICGIFKIASYRIQQAVIIKIGNRSLENKVMIYKKLVYAVNIHREAMKFLEFIFSKFQELFLCLIMFSVISLSLSLFAISRYVLLRKAEEVLIYGVLIIGILTFMFVGSNIGQEFMTHNDNVYSTAYNIQWYVAPLHAQKMILFILQRGSKSLKINVGGMVVISLESFATLTQASMSYFTVMYSMQQ